MSRVEVQPVTPEEQQAMSQIAQGLEGILDGHPRSLGLSVLIQKIAGSLEEEDLEDVEFYHRTVAGFAMINLMRDGHVQREYDQAGFAESVHNLTSIVNCGSRALMVPSLASVLVAAVANGRRDNQAEEACVSEIRDALRKLEASLSPQE